MEWFTCGGRAISERPQHTAQGYQRLRCRDREEFNERVGGSLNRTQYSSDVIALVVLWRLLIDNLRRTGVVAAESAAAAAAVGAGLYRQLCVGPRVSGRSVYCVQLSKYRRQLPNSDTLCAPLTPSASTMKPFGVVPSARRAVPIPRGAGTSCGTRPLPQPADADS